MNYTALSVEQRQMLAQAFMTMGITPEDGAFNPADPRDPAMVAAGYRAYLPTDSVGVVTPGALLDADIVLNDSATLAQQLTDHRDRIVGESVAARRGEYAKPEYAAAEADMPAQPLSREQVISLQRAVGTTPDGRWGSKSHAAAERAGITIGGKSPTEADMAELGLDPSAPDFGRQIATLVTANKRELSPAGFEQVARAMVLGDLPKDQIEAAVRENLGLPKNGPVLQYQLRTALTQWETEHALNSEVAVFADSNFGPPGTHARMLAATKAEEALRRPLEEPESMNLKQAINGLVARGLVRPGTSEREALRLAGVQPLNDGPITFGNMAQLGLTQPNLKDSYLIELAIKDRLEMNGHDVAYHSRNGHLVALSQDHQSRPTAVADASRPATSRGGYDYLTHNGGPLSNGVWERSAPSSTEPAGQAGTSGAVVVAQGNQPDGVQRALDLFAPS